jgi:hypothetical protein
MGKVTGEGWGGSGKMLGFMVVAFEELSSAVECVEKCWKRGCRGDFLLSLW